MVLMGYGVMTFITRFIPSSYGEKRGYYLDFGKIEQMVKSMKEGFVYSGEYSGFRKRNHGNSSKAIPAKQMVVFSQNHDQVAMVFT